MTINVGVLAGDYSDHRFQQIVFHQPTQRVCFACRESLKTNLLSKEYRCRGRDNECPKVEEFPFCFGSRG